MLYKNPGILFSKIPGSGLEVNPGIPGYPGIPLEPAHKEDPIPTAAITEENEQENPDESSKLINNADQMAAPKPDDVILSIEEETQAGSSESIINLDESATDSRCSRIKASISTCFSCIGRIPSCISTCFTCEHRSLCWCLGQCCKNFCLMFFCGVCCLFKRSAREKTIQLV